MLSKTPYTHYIYPIVAKSKDSIILGKNYASSRNQTTNSESTHPGSFFKNVVVCFDLVKEIIAHKRERLHFSVGRWSEKGYFYYVH